MSGNYVWLFCLFNFERSYDVLKSNISCILLNKNINFDKNGMKSKMESPTHSFSETNLVLQLIRESQIKSKTWWVRACGRKRGHFFYRLFCPKGRFWRFVFYLMYIVMNTLSEYTYFYVSKNITSYNFAACFWNHRKFSV